MWRHCAICLQCGRTSAWCGDPAESRQEIIQHLRESHGIDQGREATDYQLEAQRQCDYCLESCLDDCTKCRHDFCAFHAGDIDGLCGGCI